MTVRHNQLNVFRQLSKGYDPSQDSPLAQLPIRRRIGYSIEESAHRPMDAPGLLFYCLFDDWQTSYSLVVRRYHQYSEELDTLVSEQIYSLVTLANVTMIAARHAGNRRTLSY